MRFELIKTRAVRLKGLAALVFSPVPGLQVLESGKRFVSISWPVDGPLSSVARGVPVQPWMGGLNPRKVAPGRFNGL